MISKGFLAVFVAVLAVGWAVSMPGGLSPVDVNDEGVQNALKFALAEYNKASNAVYLYGVSHVIRAESQIVAGVKYYITVEIGKTSCRKSNPEEICTINTDPEQAKSYTCTFTVWSIPWRNEMKLVNTNCN